MIRDFPRRPLLFLAVASVLAVILAVPSAAAQGASGPSASPARLIHADQGARLWTGGGSIDLPNRPGLTYSSSAPLASRPGAGETPGPGEGAWIAAGVEPVMVAPGDPTFAPTAATGLVLYEVRTDGEEGAARFHRVAAPAVTAPVLRDPEPVVAGGTLAGLAWLEGSDHRSLAVRFAPRSAAGAEAGEPGWGGAETVAAPGPGSQLALSAARLDDGSVLLAWSRYDGEDDEIYWSLRRDGAWSAPARLAPDDTAPDITPVLRAVPGGALAAWAGFGDGRYRVLTARWDGRSWSAPAALSGAGTFPTFEEAHGGDRGPGAHLLYRTADGWRVVEVDDRGRPGRWAEMTSAGRVRPAVVAVDGGGPTLAWPPDPNLSLGRSILTWEAAELDSGPEPGTEHGDGNGEAGNGETGEGPR